MYMACLDNTQAYNHQEQVYGLFVIIKNNTLKYIWTCVIWVCYHQNHSLHELNMEPKGGEGIEVIRKD